MTQARRHGRAAADRAGSVEASCSGHSRFPSPCWSSSTPPALEVLLIERADKPGFWQSVTGSKDSPDEPLRADRRREVPRKPASRSAAPAVPLAGLRDWQLHNVYEIYPSGATAMLPA